MGASGGLWEEEEKEEEEEAEDVQKSRLVTGAAEVNVLFPAYPFHWLYCSRRIRFVLAVMAQELVATCKTASSAFCMVAELVVPTASSEPRRALR